jgi:hypothetical protein
MNPSKTTSFRRASIRILAALGVCVALSGCIVAPYGPYYRPYPHYYRGW